MATSTNPVSMQGLQLSYFRLFLAFILLLIEVLVLSVLIDARTIAGDSILAKVLAESGNFLRFLIATAAVLFLCLAKNLKARIAILVDRNTQSSLIFPIFLHIVSFAIILPVSFIVFDPNQANKAIFSYTWLLTLLLVVISAALVITNARNWREFLSKEKEAIVFSILGGILIFLFGLFSQQYWNLLTGFTLGATKQILEFFYSNIVFDSTQKVIGLKEFWVFVDKSCSGIEGMVLAFCTASIYIFLSRRFLKFPHAFVILPFACLISVVLNIVRITVLIVIGAEISSTIAVGGFHSVAGWIASVLVALLIVFVFSNWSWIQKSTSKQQAAEYVSSDADVSIGTLVSFVLFAGFSLVSGIFIVDFDYLYPLKVVLVAASLAYFWKHFKFSRSKSYKESLLIGSIVALTWVFLVPAGGHRDALLFENLAQLPLWALIGWTIFRLIGFWIIAPILEELVFRGYLLSRFSGQEFDNNRKPNFNWISLIVTSLLFGLLHGAWLAGTVAGLLFAFCRFRSKTITAPIAAHATANILVTGWAIYSGRWSLV